MEAKVSMSMKEWGRWGEGEERDKDDDKKREEDMRAEDPNGGNG